MGVAWEAEVAGEVAMELVAAGVEMVAATMVAGRHRQHLHPLHVSRWAPHPTH